MMQILFEKKEKKFLPPWKFPVNNERFRIRKYQLVFGQQGWPLVASVSHRAETCTNRFDRSCHSVHQIDWKHVHRIRREGIWNQMSKNQKSAAESDRLGFPRSVTERKNKRRKQLKERTLYFFNISKLHPSFKTFLKSTLTFAKAGWFNWVVNGYAHYMRQYDRAFWKTFA